MNVYILVSDRRILLDAPKTEAKSRPKHDCCFWDRVLHILGLLWVVGHISLISSHSKHTLITQNIHFTEHCMPSNLFHCSNSPQPNLSNSNYVIMISYDIKEPKWYPSNIPFLYMIFFYNIFERILFASTPTHPLAPKPIFPHLCHSCDRPPSYSFNCMIVGWYVCSVCLIAKNMSFINVWMNMKVLQVITLESYWILESMKDLMIIIELG